MAPPPGNTAPAVTVLIVDDDADSREMLVHHLTFSGFTVAEAASGAEALHLAERLHPQVVLMDLAMPRMHGAEAIRRLKSNAATRDITVLAVTAHVLPRNLTVAQAAGADGVFSKPVDLDALVISIRDRIVSL